MELVTTSILLWQIRRSAYIYIYSNSSDVRRDIANHTNVWQVPSLHSQGLPYIYSISKRLEAHRKLQLVYTVKNFIKIANISAQIKVQIQTAFISASVCNNLYIYISPTIPMCNRIQAWIHRVFHKNK